MRVMFAATRGAGHVGPLLPLVRACKMLVPLFVDGPSNARRVAELGAGIALDGGPTADIGGAVQELLAMPRYSWAGGLVAAEILSLPPIDEAVRALEAIAQRSAAGQAIR
jgi:UDP:flavonoid glycosyltransferase YjiC (YdhE family)